VQHLAHVAASLQQLPSQAIADLVPAPLLQVEQPVVIRIPAAKTAARIIIVFMSFTFGCSWAFRNAPLPIALTAAVGKSFAAVHFTIGAQRITRRLGRERPPFSAAVHGVAGNRARFELNRHRIKPADSARVRATKINRPIRR
jgi:hypothetical protein